MRNIIIGVLAGLIVGGGIGWAASSYITLQSANGQVINSANPLPIQSY